MPEADFGKYARLRPLFGAVVCYALFRVAFVVFAFAAQFLGGEMAALTIPMLAAALVANALSMATFEARGLADLGLRWVAGSGRNLVTGLALGLGSALLAVIPAVAAGQASYRGVPGADVSWRAALFMPVLLACGALGEEVAFRGFVLQYLVRGWRGWIAVVSTGVLFGWLHNDNPSATPLSDLNTAAFGILFGIAVLRSHDLWLAAGLHFGWNVTLPFLGVAVSGLTIRVTGYELAWKTGDLWSGGKYGPEASILTSAVLVLLFLLVWKVPVHRGRAYLLDGADGSPLPD